MLFVFLLPLMLVNKDYHSSMFILLVRACNSTTESHKKVQIWSACFFLDARNSRYHFKVSRSKIKVIRYKNAPQLMNKWPALYDLHTCWECGQRNVTCRKRAHNEIKRCRQEITTRGCNFDISERAELYIVSAIGPTVPNVYLSRHAPVFPIQTA